MGVVEKWGAALVLVGAVAALAAGAHAGGRTVSLRLDPNAPGVAAQARLVADRLEISVRGLPAGAPVSAIVDHGECARVGTRVGAARADGHGRVSFDTSTRDTPELGGEGPVLTLASRGRVVACGSIPSSRPTEGRGFTLWRIWSFGAHFTD